MEQRIYFHNLDKIRFYAALAIFLGHGTQAIVGYFFQPETEFGNSLAHQIMVNAPLGVELFFFISGFLITYILLKEKELTGKIAIGKFFIRRAIRIWPLYFLLILITPILISWLGYEDPSYLPNLLFIGNFDIIHHGASYPFTHFWSIAIEEQFYFVWPFIIAFIPRRFLAYVFVGIILTSMLFRYSFMFEEKTYYYLYYHTFSRMDTLVIGACMALIFSKSGRIFSLKPIILIALIALFIGLFFFTDSNFWNSTFMVLFKKYIYLIPLVPLTLHFVLRPQEKEEGLLGRVTTYLGKSSYGLYMIHNMLIAIIVNKLMINNHLSVGWIFWLLYTSFTVIFVVLSFELYEKPLLKLKRYFTVIKTRRF